MTTIDVLRAARALIAEPERWTQRVLARDVDGEEVDPASDEATCWCAEGALYRAASHPWGDTLLPDAPNAIALGLLRKASTCTSVADFNDEHAHVAVLALFDRAIAALEAP